MHSYRHAGIQTWTNEGMFGHIFSEHFTHCFNVWDGQCGYIADWDGPHFPTRLRRRPRTTMQNLDYPLWFASLLTTVGSVGHDFSSSLQMQRGNKMLQLASSLGFMYWILFFASFTDTSTLMAWNIRQSKDAAFCPKLSVSLAYLPFKGQHANVSGWEQKHFQCMLLRRHPRTTMQSLVRLMPLRKSDSQEWCASYSFHMAFIWPSYGCLSGVVRARL